MFTLEDCLETIQSHYPDLQIHSAEANTIGQFNHVILVNNDLIFRFPRYAADVAVLSREAVILDAVGAQLPLPVPHFTYRSLSGAPGQVFAGYRRIPGELLWRERLADIRQSPVVPRLAHQMAAFLYALHNLPVQSIAVDLPLQGGVEMWAQKYREIRELLFPYMRPDARSQVAAHFEGYLSDVVLQRFTPCLIHGDFGPSNVLVDPEAQVISGVIDFGFAGLGDPAQDIAAASCFGDAFLAQYAGAYPGMEGLLPRAHFIRGTFALEEALHGIKNDDKEAFESGIADYR